MRCDNCNEIIKQKDHVYLDIWNEIYHVKCQKRIKHDIKDFGTFKDIVEKYPFFDELRKELTVIK